MPKPKDPLPYGSHPSSQVAHSYLDDGYLFHKKKHKPVELPELLAPLADTHGHLTSFRSIDPVAAVVRAALAGVRLLVVPVDPSDDVKDVRGFLGWFARLREEARSALDALAAEGVTPPVVPGWESAPDLTDNLHFIAGVHPYGAKQFLEDRTVRARLDALLDDPHCVGVGECGIDQGPWNELGTEVQLDAFRDHLRIANERNLPIELHLRDATDDLQAEAHIEALRIMREEGIPAAGCDLHCYTSGPEVMEPFTDAGCHIAFGGASTFNRSTDIRAAIACCPEDLLLSETDSPYMAPMPLRGKECEPAMVALTVANIARVREEAGVGSARETYEALWRNALSFFALD